MLSNNMLGYVSAAKAREKPFNVNQFGIVRCVVAYGLRDNATAYKCMYVLVKEQRKKEIERHLKTNHRRKQLC